MKTLFCKEWKQAQYKRGIEAMKECIEKKRDVKNAFILKNFGFVELKWGKPGIADKDFIEGYGVAHIIAKRNHQKKDSGIETAFKVIDVLCFGELVENQKRPHKLLYRKDGFEASLSLKFFGDRACWLLTGYKMYSKRLKKNQKR